MYVLLVCYAYVTRLNIPAYMHGDWKCMYDYTYMSYVRLNIYSTNTC